MPIIINPSQIQDEAQQRQVAEFLRSTPRQFIEKDKSYDFQGDTITFTQNVIKTQPDTQDTEKFYVISNEDDDVLGKGAFSKARKITGSIVVSQDNSLQYQQVQGKAVRIKNTQYAQQKRDPSKPYQHAEAQKEHRKAQKFPHLGMEEPVEVKKDKPQLGQFSKSYSVMNEITGGDFIENSFDYLQVGPSTQGFLDIVIIPMLEAYKAQVADRGYVHRDIKAENILLNIDFRNTPPTTVNFIDVDSAKRPGKGDQTFGSPGYLPPEVFDQPSPPVSQSRDIFGLGMLLIGCMNPDLDTGCFLTNVCGASSGQEAIEKHFELLEAMGCYDPEKLVEKGIKEGVLQYDSDMAKANLFAYLDSGAPSVPLDAQNQIREILKLMTSKNPSDRPDIDTIINKLKAVSLSLRQGPVQQAVTVVAAQTDTETKVLSSTSTIATTLNGSEAVDSLKSRQTPEQKPEPSPTLQVTVTVQTTETVQKVTNETENTDDKEHKDSFGMQ